MSTPPASRALRDARWIRWSVAFVWLATGVLVLHPAYREVGSRYLSLIGLPDAVMVATCLGEVLLGLRVALGPASTWITLLQVTLITGFTGILAVAEPRLLVAGEGYLLKNLPLVVLLGVAWLLEREGWTWRTRRLLLGGLVLYWVLQGVFVNLLFARLQPQRGEHPVLLHQLVGGAEVLLALAVLAVAGLPRVLCVLALGGLQLLLPTAGMLLDLALWVHPFGPVTKLVPLTVGAAVLLLDEVSRRVEPPVGPSRPGGTSGG
jgi:hypothetical protein